MIGVMEFSRQKMKVGNEIYNLTIERQKDGKILVSVEMSDSYACYKMSATDERNLEHWMSCQGGGDDDA